MTIFKLKSWETLILKGLPAPRKMRFVEEFCSKYLWFNNGLCRKFVGIDNNLDTAIFEKDDGDYELELIDDCWHIVCFKNGVLK